MSPVLLSALSYGIPILIGVVVFLFLVTRWLVNVGAKEIAIKERRYIGAKMPPGRVVATNGQVGIQADVLKPGLHFIKWPLERVVDRRPLVEIGANEVGIVEAIDGEPMPPDRIFAPDKAQNKHNNFQDPIAFLNHGGVKGIQMRTLPPGKWPIHPYLFRMSIASVTVIPEGQVGVVVASDGEALNEGRLLGKAIDGHNHFQDGESFIACKGQKGPQVEILTPGTYRIHRESTPMRESRNQDSAKPGIFHIELRPATVVEKDRVGLVEALDGQPMNSKDYVAQPVNGHGDFQNGNAFITNGGQRGPQKQILLPGTYYINPLLFKVLCADAKEVKAGEVAVIVSNEGPDPTQEQRQQIAQEVRQRLEELGNEHVGEEKEETAEGNDGEPPENGDPAANQLKANNGDPADKRLDAGVKEAYVVPDGCRGIQKTVVGPGKYYINTLAETPVVVPTTNLTVEWNDDASNKNSFDPFEVVSEDGFKMKIEVMAVFRVKPEDAPFMVSKIGNIDNLKQNVMHPVIDSIFRNQASGSSAMNYLKKRHAEQVRAEKKVREHLLPYHVDVINVLIRHIHLPEELMNTQTQKILAQQSQAMFDEQKRAEEKRIQLESTKAKANNQAALMQETVGVEIAEQKALQRMKEAEGQAKYTKQVGEAEAEVTRLKGEAQGEAYRKQVEALGQGGVALVQAIDKLAAAGIRITPDIQAGGADGGGNLGAVITALLAKQLANNTPAVPPARDTKSS